MIRTLSPPLIRTALVCLLAALATALLPGAASAQSAQIETELRLERRLLALDLAAYREARTVEQRARDLMTQTGTRMDQALTGSSVALGTLESLYTELAASKAAAQIAADRVDWQLLRLQDRLRRIGFLEGELRPGGAGATAADALSGRWRVRLLPQNQTAVFELSVSGTIVSGTYRIDGGSSGSLRGTFAEGRLRLERVDAARGFDTVYLGTLGTQEGVTTIRGSWAANELASGQPARGEWVASREGT